MKALIVDDDPTSRFVLKMALTRSFSWTTVEVADGRAALAALEAEPVDIVFLDVHMPGMSGVETLQALRQSPKHAELPVVMLTGDRDQTTVQAAAALGIADYMVKPLSPQGISVRLLRILSSISEQAHPLVTAGRRTAML